MRPAHPSVLTSALSGAHPTRLSEAETRATQGFDLLLSVRDLSVEFVGGDSKPTRVLDGIHLQIASGEAVGILGESGCGKSTLARSLLRLLPPHARIAGGSIRFEGQELLAAHEDLLCRLRGARIALIHQEPAGALHPTLRIDRQVAEVLHAHRPGSWKDCLEEARAALAEVFPLNLERIARCYPHELSGGQRQRVLVAQAFACCPALIVADEPTASLDLATQAEVLRLIRDLQRRFNSAFVFITHNPILLPGLVDRVLVMYAGQVVEEGACEPVFCEPLHPYTEGLLRLIRDPAAAPAGERKSALAVIGGAAPDFASLPPGCRFEPRCPRRMVECSLREPPEVFPGVARRVRCFLHDGE